MIVGSTRNTDHLQYEEIEYSLNNDLVKLYHDDTKKFIAYLINQKLNIEEIGTLCLLASIKDNNHILTLSPKAMREMMPNCSRSEMIGNLQELWYEGYLDRDTD